MGAKAEAEAKEKAAEGKKNVQWWADNQDQFSGLSRLPANWIRIRSNGSGRIYFVNTMSGKTQFVEPEDELPPGWRKVTSRSSGKMYFFNTTTGQSTFDRPIA